MKKVFILVAIAVLTVFQAQAVLKEKDLPQTLGVLRAELAQAYNEQQAIMARFEKRNVEQHSRLVHLMQSSNQIALMLFSQNSDFTLDMAYACQAATEQYRKLKTYHAPYDKMKERIKRQMSERTQMLAGVSHDLRTPITRMKLALAMAEKSEENQAFLEDVLEMEKMLEGYLSFARGDGAEESVSVDMNALISGIVAKFKSAKNKIKYEKNENISLFLGREQALKRMVSNIISNACRYAKNIEVDLKETNNRLEITVDDDGPGIPENKREDVFKAFYRLEESRNKETGGVGLGLSITKDIVRSHGGSIRLSDSPLGGLRVEIKLPL